ncbi:MAG TPA: hypothetical protein VN249_06520, partial [Prolixibacteraceae bacterium]|nr:hypothetical protein [Prolixibacteraceae bacterium]
AIGPLDGDVGIMMRKCSAGRLFSYDEKEKMSLFILEIFEQVQNGTFRSQTTGTEKYTRRNLTEELIKCI